MSNCNNCNQSSGSNCTGNNIYVSGSDTRLAIDVSNNKSRYYAELAEGYKNEAKNYRDSAMYYAEQNSDVTMSYVNGIEASLTNMINGKQDAGNYALASAIPTKTSDLTNDSNYMTAIPTATTSNLGVVKPDGNTLSIDVNGVISTNISFRSIGEIIISTIPLTDAGLHLLDGTQLSGSGSYAAFVDYIADLYDSGDYTAIFDTEANWQAAVTANGVCGKFVYDSVNNTVRLPKYSNKIYSSLNSNVSVAGTGKALGLTDGTTVTSLGYHSASYGLFPETYTTDNLPKVVGSYPSYSGGALVGVTTDGTKSGIIADLSNITTSLDGYYYIVIATTTKTDIQVDIDEIATDLNGKADVDLTNCTKPHIIETYVNGTSWYRVWSDKWCEQGGYVSVGANNGEYTYTLLKEFIDTNYHITGQFASYYSTDFTSNRAMYPYTTTQFKILSRSIIGGQQSWLASGYIK